MRPTRVLVIDDSALARQVLREVLSSDPAIEVVGVTPDPLKAWERMIRLGPDVLTLDFDRPDITADARRLEFLERLMRVRPTPVVMCTSLGEGGRTTILRALELGAVDFIETPALDRERGLTQMAAEIIRKVKSAALAHPHPRPGGPASAPTQRIATPVPFARSEAGLVFALGASTGGTEALLEVLERLPADAPGAVVVQHMPEAFTKAFAERLDRHCTVRVRQARDGDPVLPGQVLIAPGGAAHMVLLRGDPPLVRLVESAPVHYHRPSVDVLFESCARAVGARAVGALLTGMGCDGAKGLLEMRRRGARTIAQDEASSVIFGMPREAIARGAAEFVVPLAGIGAAILRLGAEARQTHSATPRFAPSPPTSTKVP